MLEKEQEYFIKSQDDLVKNHLGEFVVIKSGKILGFYKTKEDAFTAAIQNHAIGTFLIRQCVPGSEAYTQTFHSRVIFS
jgi:hypothetical protein